MGLFAYQHENLKLVSNMLLRGALQLFLIKLKRPESYVSYPSVSENEVDFAAKGLGEKKPKSDQHKRSADIIDVAAVVVAVAATKGSSEKASPG